MKAATDAHFGDAQRILPLIGKIYSAVEDAALWPLVLDQLAELVQGQEILLWTNFSAPEGTNILCSARMDPSALIPYAQYYGSVNVLADRCDDMYEDGQVRYSNRAVPDPEFETTEFYNDYFRPNGMYHSLGVKLPLGEQAAPYLACMRPKHKGSFEEAEGSLVSAIIPHLQQALRLHLKFSQLHSNSQGLEFALDALDHAVFGLNRRGRVVVSNRQAEQLAQCGDGIKLSNGFLVATGHNDNARMQAQIAAAVTTGTGCGVSPGSSFLLNRKPGKAPLSLTVSPFLANPLVGNHSQLAALVFVVDPTKKPLSRSETMRSLYQLTPAEGFIADSLAEGLDVAAVSEKTRFTQATVRFYLKSIFRKTGVNRQSELMKLILRLPGV